jgi:hypothetical protein
MVEATTLGFGGTVAGRSGRTIDASSALHLGVGQRRDAQIFAE